MLANGSALAFEGRALLWDYVPWEQMSKQRRGIMWAMNLAHSTDRTVVLPPLRFHTKETGVYEYVPYSDLFELQPLAALHPVTELKQLLASTSGNVDLLFSVLKGLPKGAISASNNGTPNQWVEGECKQAPAEAACAVNEQGEEVCRTPLPHFAGAVGGVHVRNMTCGWAPDMRWDRILRQGDVRHVPSVGIQGIVYQIPPPSSMAPLVAFRDAERAGNVTCGWRCPYELVRTAMVYRRNLVQAAHFFLLGAKQRHLALGVAQQRGELSGGAVYDYASGEGPELGSGSSALERSALALSSSSGGGGGGGSHAGHAGGLPGLLAAARPVSSSHSSSLAAAERVRVLAIHWRRGDFLGRSTHEQACVDEATGAKLVDESRAGRPCPSAQVVLTPSQLAAEARDALRRHNATLIFLASNAKKEEVAQLERELGGAPLVRYEPPPTQLTPYTAAELAILDTLICSLADAFIGTRRSMFSWNILEERVMQGHNASTGALMGLPRSARRAEAPEAQPAPGDARARLRQR